ncbi:hypothetical protein BDP27DRAFT_1397093, partial [Rhodocollybia butyracea]
HRHHPLLPLPLPRLLERRVVARVPRHLLHRHHPLLRQRPPRALERRVVVRVPQHLLHRRHLLLPLRPPRPLERRVVVRRPQHLLRRLLLRKPPRVPKKRVLPAQHLLPLVLPRPRLLPNLPPLHPLELQEQRPRLLSATRLPTPTKPDTRAKKIRAGSLLLRLSQLRSIAPPGVQRVNTLSNVLPSSLC